MPLVIGVDSSTQSTKVELRDLDTGELMGTGAAAHTLTTPPRSEQEPEEWWTAFEAALERAEVQARRDHSGRDHAIAGVSVAGQQHGMVVLDAAGDVIRPAKLWNDTESAPDAGWLLKQLPGGAADWSAACGSVPVGAFTIAKLSWLHRSEPSNWERIARVMLPHDWMTYRLTGSFVTDRGDASGTGYWSPATGEYRWDLLGIIDKDRDWTSAVPTVLGPTEAAGTWRDAVVAAGTGDNMAAALGLGLRPGDAAMSFGSSGTVFTTSDVATADPSGSVAGFADATGGFLPLVCTSNATTVTDTIARLLGVTPVELDALAMQGPPGADGMTLLPYFGGERTPNRPKATGWLNGLRTDASRESLARAAVEGVVCGMLDALDALRAVTGPVRRIVMSGGGAGSAAYRQVLADLCDVPVVVSDAVQAAATGACVQAAALAGGVDSAVVAARWKLGGGTLVEPSREASSDVAGAVRSRYAALRDATS